MGVIPFASLPEKSNLGIPRVYGGDPRRGGFPERWWSVFPVYTGLISITQANFHIHHSSKSEPPTKGLAFLSLIILFRMMFSNRADPSSATVTKNRFNGWNQCCNEGECVDLPVDQHVKRHENQVFEFTTAVIDNQGRQ